MHIKHPSINIPLSILLVINCLVGVDTFAFAASNLAPPSGIITEKDFTTYITFEEYITTSFGRGIEAIQELELFAMWPLYLSEVDRGFADSGDFRRAYGSFYNAHARHLAEGRINIKKVRAYVPIIRRPFSSLREIKEIVNIKAECSIDFFPEPGNWQGPSLYGFILSVVKGQLHMCFYDGNGLIREFNTDKETEAALRTIGMIGEEGLIVLVRSSFDKRLKDHAVLGMGGRISLSGHSHPKGSGVIPSKSKSLGNPADVELITLRLIGLPEGYPINEDIPKLAAREEKSLDEEKAEAPEQLVAVPTDNLHSMLGNAIERVEAFAGSQAGQETPLPVNELVLYLKVLQAMHAETIGTYEGSSADHEYVHTYRAEFAGELAHHPQFNAAAERMLQDSLEGAFRVLAEQIHPGFMDEPGSLSRMMSVVSQLIEESSSHPEFRERAVDLINDPRTYGLGDIVIKKPRKGKGVPAIEGKQTRTPTPQTKGIRGLLVAAKRIITGEDSTEKQPTTALVTTQESAKATAIAVRANEFASVSDQLVKAAKKGGKSDLSDDLKPRPEDVVRTRAARLLVLADRSANDDPEIAEAALREYLRLVKTFGDKIDFYVAVTLDRYKNIMDSSTLRPVLIETARSVHDTEDRNNMLTRIAVQLTEEGDIQGSLDLLEEIGTATFYTFSVALEQLVDLILTPGKRDSKMIQQLERIIENVPVVSSRGRYDVRKIGLFVKLGDKYDEIGMRGEANSNYKKAWDLSERAERPAITRLEYFVPLMREKGLEFQKSRTEIIDEARRIGELEILGDRLSGSPNTLIAIAREHAFNRDYEKAEEIAQFINDNMDYPRDHYDHCHGAIIEAAALHEDNDRIGPAAKKMTHYVKDHFERAAQLLVDRGEYQKAMSLANLAMAQGYMGGSSVGYWGSMQLRIAKNILKKDSTQIEMVRESLGEAISVGGISDSDLETIIDIIAEYPQLDPDGQFTLRTLQAGFERNQSIIKHHGHRVILRKLREIIMARVRDVYPSLRSVKDVYGRINGNLALPAPAIEKEGTSAIEGSL